MARELQFKKSDSSAIWLKNLKIQFFMDLIFSSNSCYEQHNTKERIDSSSSIYLPQSGKKTNPTQIHAISKGFDRYLLSHISLLSLAQRPQFELGSSSPAYTFRQYAKYTHEITFCGSDPEHTQRSSIRLFVLGPRRCPFLWYRSERNSLLQKCKTARWKQFTFAEPLQRNPHFEMRTV